MWRSSSCPNESIRGDGIARTLARQGGCDALTEERKIFRTLVVDDDPPMRDVNRMILEHSKRFKVIAEGADGLEAIDRAAEHQPDLVLLDITMPGMDGFEALPHIRSVSPDSNVVVLTGLSGPEVRQKALDLGAVGMLEKEPDAKKFLKDLLDILENEGDPASSTS